MLDMEATISGCKNTLQCTSSTNKAVPKIPLHTGFIVKQRNLRPTLLFPGLQDNLKSNNNLPFNNTPAHQKYGSVNVPKAQMPSSSDNAETSANKIQISVRTLAVAFCFGGVAGFLRTLLSVLPPDFGKRWHKLVHEKDHDSVSIGNESGAGTIIYDCHGAVIAKIVPPSRDVRGGKGRKERRPLRASDIPSFMWQAVVASEDRRFFEHHGIDPKGLARAALSMSAGGGGSTITQQLVKNVFLTNDRKWERKVVEMILALLVERHMSKWDILFSYLNKKAYQCHPIDERKCSPMLHRLENGPGTRKLWAKDKQVSNSNLGEIIFEKNDEEVTEIYWGHGIYGIERASAFYFGKHPSLLTLGECAMLAGIIPAPELLSPYRDPSRGKKPQGRTLRRMVEAGFLHLEMADEALCETLFMGSNGQGVSGPWRAPYFVSEVLYELAQKYGHDAILRDGLQVYTTLDLERQEMAEKIIDEEAAGYDQERITLAEKKLKKAHEKIDDLCKARQKEIDKAVTRAITRVTVEWKHSAKLSAVLPEPANVSREAMLAEAVAAASEKAHSTVVGKYATAERRLQDIVSRFEMELKEAAKSRLEGAVVAIEPLSGAVQILVGGRNFLKSGFNRATLAFRSPGSTFKPIVFLAALAEGMTRAHTLLDEPYTFGDFTPENYDKKFRGRVTLEEALVKSLNVPTVKLCAEIGVDKVCNMSRALGIDSPLPYELPLSLGGCEVTPLQLATVYSTIAAGGFYHKPYIIRRVETGNGRVLEEVENSNCQPKHVVDENAISEIRQLLQAVVERGTGCAARLGRPCAGKTGTSDGHRDVWFAGFTPELTCVVWFGYDDNATVGGLHPGTGASHAAPVWKRLMKHIHKGLPVKKFHDRGSDKYGMRSPYFIRKSRRACRIGVKDVRNSTKENHEKIALREIWDWENASSVWNEKEKMKEWTEDRLKQADKTKVARAP